jgi:hypothetical protein
MSQMTQLKTLGKGELVRRLIILNAGYKKASEELSKWMDGFVTACAYLKLEKPEHPYIATLAESTMREVDKKVQELTK